MRELRAILLDFGGTLDSDGKHWSTQLAESFAEVGGAGRRDRSEMDRAFLAVDRALQDEPASARLKWEPYVTAYVSRMSARLDLPPDRVASVVTHFLARAAFHFRRNVALLAKLRDTYRLAIVSNFTANLPLLVEEVGLAETVSVVVCSAVEGLRKPDRAIFQLALDRLGVAPEQAAMIGDSLGNDLAPAKSLGLATVWLRGDKDHSGGDVAVADGVVDSLPAAFDWLARGGAVGCGAAPCGAAPCGAVR